MKVLVSDPIAESGMSILKYAGIEVHYLPEESIEEKKIGMQGYAWLDNS